MSETANEVRSEPSADGHQCPKMDSSEDKDIGRHSDEKNDFTVDVNTAETVTAPEATSEEVVSEVLLMEAVSEEPIALKEIFTDAKTAEEPNIPTEETKASNQETKDSKPCEEKKSTEPVIKSNSFTGDSLPADRLAPKTGDGSHDWTCFECHIDKGAEPLVDCVTCHRAYHSRCLRGKQTGDPLRCPICRINEEPERSGKLLDRTREELNKCIELMINNLQLGYSISEFDDLAINEKDAEVKKRLHTQMDLLRIRHKALTAQYEYLREAVVDFKQFVHNFLVLHRSRCAEMRDLERKFNHEVKEIRVCVDCYKYSSDIAYDNNDNPHHWFLLVCDPPHELVFAKYQKYPFWPAKVIEVKPDGKNYDVRFFDAPVSSRVLSLRVVFNLVFRSGLQPRDSA